MNNSVHVAVKTKNAIDQAIKQDQGAQYRMWLGKVIPHMGDAYSGDTFPFRKHMGASLIGGECARSIWYGFRWAQRPSFEGRLLRLFNRGHLEEARFIAQLLTIGAKVYQQDENGKQYRISDCNGHFGGSGDGIAIGIPDLDPAQACLLEFKTHSEKSFNGLIKSGVMEAKFEHYVQMNIYMYKMGLPVALYGAVNKNNDDTYWELVTLNSEVAEAYIERAAKIIPMTEAPKRLSETPGYYKCKFCDKRSVCHVKGQLDKNCRTCKFSKTVEDGDWFCTKHMRNLDKDAQLAGCADYRVNEGFYF